MRKYDAIIVGTGQAGPAFAGHCLKNDWKIAVVEKSHYGGSCVNVGCTPTKAYVASARRAFAAKNSAIMGVGVPDGVKVDLKTVKARKDAIVNESRDGLQDFLEGSENTTVYKGTAEFTGTHSVRVNGEEISADKIFINVGARPRVPDNFDGVDYLTNETILELEEIPQHLVVIGGGYIGLEFAQMFRRFGSEVTIVEKHERVMHKEDDDIGGEIMKILGQEGIHFRTNASCISARPVDEGVQVNLDCEEGKKTVVGSHMLLAVGRVPNTDILNLEKAGIECDEGGLIEVNQKLQTNLAHVYALGDCNGRGAFTHTSVDDAEIANSQIFGDGNKTLSDRYPCYAMYIDPPLARVGLSEKQVREKELKAKMATLPMSKVARAKEKGETMGLMKVIADADTDKILGATFLGTGADEYIHSIIDIMYAGAPYTVVRDAVHIHPTVSELIPTMLKDMEVINGS